MVAGGHGLDHREADAEPPGSLGREEGLARPCPGRRVHPAPRVDDGQLDARPPVPAEPHRDGVPVVSGLVRSKERATMSMGCETFGEIEHKLAAAIAKPIPPKFVNGSPRYPERHRTDTYRHQSEERETIERGTKMRGGDAQNRFPPLGDECVAHLKIMATGSAQP